ncbi:MAG: SDR family oxidoreductase [Alphaproteobacteria bacterium]|nr:SDR family oxidoreductase [Alphaproteobacteria bacterium]
MVGFTRMASREFGPDGVTINAISLGTMNNFDDFSGIAARSTAVGRAGTPDDVGALAVYLASVEASWITGQVIALNGGSNVS